ncbi:MAG: YtpR family tRNA-binding protein, partial [Gemmatimonadota bacterium]
MNVSLRWLEELLGTSLDPVETRDRLLMLGAGVEAMEPLHHDLAEVVIGEVLEVRKHPNADRLTLCEVNAGAEVKHVVCGATNVTAGKKYPFAAVGTTLPGGLLLERRKIRGEVSEGMLCSAKELGLGEDGDGILELDTAATPGTRLLDALPLADTRFVLEITPNRPDQLSHEGIARD